MVLATYGPPVFGRLAPGPVERPVKAEPVAHLLLRALL